MEFVTQNESVNPEIDKALSKAPSKTGGEGANLVDVKLLLKDSKLDYYPIMIELKWGSNKLVKLDKEDHVANTKTSGKEKGEDWNFDHHIQMNTIPTIDDFRKTVSDYLAWEVAQLIQNRGEDSSKKN